MIQILSLYSIVQTIRTLSRVALVDPFCTGPQRYLEAHVERVWPRETNSYCAT